MIDEGPFNTSDTFELARAVRRGETLQWQDADGSWLTPRDRETMLRILRQDPTRTYRLVTAGVEARCPNCGVFRDAHGNLNHFAGCTAGVRTPDGSQQ